MSGIGSRARNKWAKAAGRRRRLIEAAVLSDGVIIDGMVTRTCEATGEPRLACGKKFSQSGRPYKRQNREVGRQRAGFGGVCSSGEAE